LGQDVNNVLLAVSTFFICYILPMLQFGNKNCCGYTAYRINILILRIPWQTELKAMSLPNNGWQISSDI